MQVPGIADIKYVEGKRDCTLKMHQDPRGPARDLAGGQGAPLWRIPPRAVFEAIVFNWPFFLLQSM